MTPTFSRASPQREAGAGGCAGGDGGGAAPPAAAAAAALRRRLWGAGVRNWGWSEEFGGGFPLGSDKLQVWVPRSNLKGQASKKRL